MTNCRRWSMPCSRRCATIRGWSTWTQTSSSTRRSSTSRSTVRRQRRQESRSTRSAARSRRCSAVARSRASSRTGEQYDVVVKIADIDRQNPDDMRRIYVKGREDAMIPLSNLITIKETVAPKELNHFNQLRAATITAQLAPGYTLSDGLSFLAKTAQEVLPITAHVEYSGQSREFREASRNMYLIFLLALAFIYLVLAAQFESFTDPFIIMLTVPLSVTGALLALWWSGGTLNIYSQVGLVTLIGLITKHGILIVEFSNQLRAKGQPMREAVMEAAALRVRPILMTTGAMVLGAVPLALATGAG